MKRFIWILGLAIGLAFALILFSFINRQRMGDMFDLAYDPTRDRLYSVAGESGLYTFEAEAGHLKRVSRFYDEGYYRNVEIQGERAYIAESERGLLVLDISSDRPRLVFASQDLRGEGIQLAGGLLYLAAGEDGLIIYSLADPDVPQEIGRYVHLEDARDVAVEGRLAYVADEPRGVEILDISSPTQPTRLGFVTWDPVYAQTEIVRAEGGFVYVAAGTYGLKFIDVRNPGSPVLAAGYIAGPNSTAEGLAVHAGIVYLTVRDPQDSSQNGLHILDAHNPYSPQLLAISTYAEPSEGVILQGETVFLANPGAGIRAYNINDPTQPQITDRFRYFP